MNTTNFGRIASAIAALSCAALLTSCTTSAPEPIADVSKFPSLDQLPGKVPPRVWTGLAGVWARDHARWQTTASNDVGAVVFLGDSITEGWSTLPKDFPKMKVANRGIGGDITCGVLYRLRADVLRLHPEAIVLLIGTNDVGDGAVPDVAGNIRLILQAIKNYYPKEKVIVCKIMPRSDGNNAQLYAQKIQKANALIEAYVKTQKNCAICDTWSIFADANGIPNPVDFRPDHLHLNAAGYVVWKSALDPVLAKLDLENRRAN